MLELLVVLALSAEPEGYPRVVREGGQTCVQALDEQGTVEQTCRPDGGSYPRSSVTFPPPPPRPTRDLSPMVADFGVIATLGGTMADEHTSIPGFGLHGALGGRLTEQLALEGLADAEFTFHPEGFRLGVTVAPGVRFGRGSHFVVALGPSVIVYNDTPLRSVSVGGTLMLRQVIALGATSRVALHLHAGLTLDASGMMFAFGLGFGTALF